MAAFVLVWLIPSFPFWVAFPLLLIAYVAPLATYIVYRNCKVDNNRRVLTPEHLRYWFATQLGKIGVKMEAEKLDPHEAGPPVKVFGHSGIDERTDNARLVMARQSPGCSTAREILAEGLAVRATAFMLDYTQQAVAVRTMIDGVWIPARAARPRDRRPGARIDQAALRPESPGPAEPPGGDFRRRVPVAPLYRHLRFAGHADAASGP